MQTNIAPVPDRPIKSKKIVNETNIPNHVLLSERETLLKDISVNLFHKEDDNDEINEKKRLPEIISEYDDDDICIDCIRHHCVCDYNQMYKCPTCDNMVWVYDINGMCDECFTIEQQLYPDDIDISLRTPR